MDPDADILPHTADLAEVTAVATALSVTLHTALAKMHKAGMLKEIEDAQSRAKTDFQNAVFEGGSAADHSRMRKAGLQAIDISFSRVAAAINRGKKPN